MTNRPLELLRYPRAVVLACAVLLLPGCVARAAYEVATVPVRATGKVVNWTTTSPSESERNRARAQERRDAQRERLNRDYDKERHRCQGGDAAACGRARDIYAQMQPIAPTPPGG